jgi:hypothetical protein
VEARLATGGIRTSLACDAAVALWSPRGDPGAPAVVERMLVQAVEAGYLAAVRDVRAGELDAEVRRWRPGLAQQ